MATTADNVKELVLPAHETKHIPLLVYPFRDDVIFHLTQSDDGTNNGTALWLGAQILSAYLTDNLPCPRRTTESSDSDSSPESAPSIPIRHRQSRAIELGSGIGLTALALAQQGWSVLATDTHPVVNSVLRSNVHRNTRNTRLLGSIQVRALDWTVPPENWIWNNPDSVTPTSDKTVNASELCRNDANLLGPPFDLILTADTIYSPDLITPLLRTLKHLILLSNSAPESDSSTTPSQRKSRASVYVALEKRDPVQLASFFSQAHEIWGLSAQRVPTPRVRRALSRTGLSHWKKEDWEGVEIWRLYLLDSESNGIPTKN